MTTTIPLEGNYTITVPVPQDEELIRYLRRQLYQYRRMDANILYTNASTRGILNRLPRQSVAGGGPIPLTLLYDIRDVINAMLAADRDAYLAQRGTQPTIVRPPSPRAIPTIRPTVVVPVPTIRPTVPIPVPTLPRPTMVVPVPTLPRPVPAPTITLPTLPTVVRPTVAVPVPTLPTIPRPPVTMPRATAVIVPAPAVPRVPSSPRATAVIVPTMPRATAIVVPTIPRATVVVPQPTIAMPPIPTTFTARPLSPRAAGIVQPTTIAVPQIPTIVTVQQLSPRAAAIARQATEPIATGIAYYNTLTIPQLEGLLNDRNVEYPALARGGLRTKEILIRYLVEDDERKNLAAQAYYNTLTIPQLEGLLFERRVEYAPETRGGAREKAILIGHLVEDDRKRGLMGQATVAIPRLPSPRATGVVPTMPQPTIPVPRVPSPIRTSTVAIPTATAPSGRPPVPTVRIPSVFPSIPPAQIQPVTIPRPASPRAITVAQPRLHEFVPAGPAITDIVPTPKRVELPALDHPEDQNNPALLAYLKSRAVKYFGDFPGTVYEEITRRGLTFPTPRYFNPAVNVLLEDDRRRYLRRAQM
jgi:hypothetical protein